MPKIWMMTGPPWQALGGLGNLQGGADGGCSLAFSDGLKWGGANPESFLGSPLKWWVYKGETIKYRDYMGLYWGEWGLTTNIY